MSPSVFVRECQLPIVDWTPRTTISIPGERLFMVVKSQSVRRIGFSKAGDGISLVFYRFRTYHLLSCIPETERGYGRTQKWDTGVERLGVLTPSATMISDATAPCG